MVVGDAGGDPLAGRLPLLAWFAALGAPVPEPQRQQGAAGLWGAGEVPAPADRVGAEVMPSAGRVVERWHGGTPPRVGDTAKRPGPVPGRRLLPLSGGPHLPALSLAAA